MKYIYGLLILIPLLAGCSRDRDDSFDSNDRSRVELKAAVTNSKIVQLSPINSNFSANFSIGIYSYRTAWAAGSTNAINNDAATVLGAAGHSITFASGPYYYPSDGSILSFFAFAPFASETTAAGVGTSPVVTHSITGQEDVMWASGSGQKIGSAAATNPVLNFQHKLSQLQFTLKSDASYPPTGNKVVSILVKAQPSSVVMNVESGACTFSGSSDMQALSSTNQTNGLDITTAGTNANSPVMTKSATSYSLDIVIQPAGGGSNVTYSNVPVSITTVAGSAHMLTLVFTSTGVSATATVADWLTGTGGSVTVL